LVLVAIQTLAPLDKRTNIPVPLLGRTSGVNWIRENIPPIAVAKPYASIVFPVPGTLSSKILNNKVMAINYTSRSFQTIT
jgi:hypothetical protein